MAIYTIRMAGGVATAPVNSNIATVPAGYVWVVRDIEARQDGGSDVASVYFQGVTINPAGTIPIWGPLATVFQGSAQWQGRVVLHAGESIRLQVAGSGNLRYVVCGYQLAGTGT